MKHLKLFATLCCAALLFAACSSTTTGTENGHEWVDLGLPSGLKWATCNVGASLPIEYGNYCAWGEIKTKEKYNGDTYKWSGNEQTIKYNADSSFGTVDNKTTLDPEDDAAAANWGGKWRMPTDDEWTELRENCTWTWTADHQGTGIAGRVVTGPNGNSIFLPAAGYRCIGNLYGAGAESIYWSSSLGTDDSSFALNVYFNSGNVGRGSNYRFDGLSVRPVFK